jgi:hypothetical protein
MKVAHDFSSGVSIKKAQPSRKGVIGLCWAKVRWVFSGQAATQESLGLTHFQRYALLWG